MTLNEVMKDTADAIREKTGKSELIAPINFAEEIKSISAGGGDSEGGLYMKYYDVDAIATSGGVGREMVIRGFSEALGDATFILASVSKSDNSNGGVLPLLVVQPSIVSRVGILYGITIMDGITSGVISPEFVAAKLGMSLDQFEITKEQFYNLE